MQKLIAVTEASKWLNAIHNTPLFPERIQDPKLIKPYDISMFAGHPILGDAEYEAIVGPFRACPELAGHAIIGQNYSHVTIVTIYWGDDNPEFDASRFQKSLAEIGFRPFQLKPSKVVMNKAGEIRLLWEPVGDNPEEVFRIRDIAKQDGLSQFIAPSIHSSLVYPTTPPENQAVPESVQNALIEINRKLPDLRPVTITQIGIRKAIFPTELTTQFFQDFAETDRVTTE